MFALTPLKVGRTIFMLQYNIYIAVVNRMHKITPI